MARSAPRPYANTALAKFLQRRILELRSHKTQAQIAAEAGFQQSNMMTMIKTGAAKLPLDRVPALAKALECDPKFLFRAALSQLVDATTLPAIEQIFGTIVSENEVHWLTVLRDASDNSDPSLTSRRAQILRAIFGR